jgi:hypothetical protein
VTAHPDGALDHPAIPHLIMDLGDHAARFWFLATEC